MEHSLCSRTLFSYNHRIGFTLGMLSSQFRCDCAKAGGENVVSDLRDNGVAVGSHYFEIGPPLRECAADLG